MFHKVEEIRRKRSFYNELKWYWYMHSADDLIMCLIDFNGYVVRDIDGFDGLHVGYGVGQWNFEGRMLLEFCLKKEFGVLNIWLRRGKEEDSIQNE